MSATRPYHVAFTLARFRLGVSACCWAIGIALTVQVVVWTMAVFTQVRFAPDPDLLAPTAAVSSGDELAAETEMLAVGGDEAVVPPAAPAPRPRSMTDQLMRQAIASAAVVGPVAFVAMLPLMAIGVIVAVVGQVQGTERAASALLWGFLLACVGLPVGSALGVASYQGIFLGYDALTTPIDATMGDDGFSDIPPILYARHLVLPVASMVAVALVGLLYRAGLESGLMPKEFLRVDPVLDRETSRLAANGPRLGGRTAAALGATMTSGSPLPTAPPTNGPPEPAPPSAPATPARTTMSTSAGDAPRRII